MTVRAAEKAAREGGARRKPRKTAAVDPALAARALAAMEQLTGRTVRVRRAALEVEFRDETGLAELAEALEQALE
jgi:hypothetical protein